ncbi:hypothetical protein [uncultured Nocardioides sp.]|uniref:hypothetical protein n=1 Tax=uncultured Nocardioides sp. TaxID=198441 RepID=UPI00261AFA13|nr:hypothetical protein [uncultured Nocardioides sp.]
MTRSVAEVDVGQAARIRARALTENAAIVILPLRNDERTGKAVYAEDTLFLAKRLQAEGVRATYLDAVGDRVFVSENSAVLAAVGSLALGIVGSAAYDGLKALVTRIWRTDAGGVSITVTDATNPAATQWVVSGERAQVVQTIEELKARALLPRATAASNLVPADEGPPPSWTSKIPSARVDALIDERLDEADELAALAQRMLAQHPPEVPSVNADAEAIAVRALGRYRSALDWAEDTDREHEVHERLDAAGKRKRHAFGCKIEYEDNTYYETCPVSLGHVRVGLSVGGTATRLCSLCGEDISACEHDPTHTYLVPGGSAVRDYCRICVESDCKKHKSHLLYEATPVAIVTQLSVDEVSIVARPAQPDARIYRQSIDMKELERELGADFRPGMTLHCNKCLSECGGLKQVSLR